MKKIIIAMAAIAAAFTMASCNKELVEPENTPTEGNCIITASTESNLTKTSLIGNDTDGYEVVWSEGDTFVIGGNTFTLIDGAGTTNGKFQGTLPEGDGPFTAYYPATYNGTDWPASQTYTEGNITGSPMTAEVVKGAESLSFKNAGGILRLTLKGTDEIRKITVKADGLDEIALKYDSGVTLNADGIVFHIALPEGGYEGASITIYTKNWDYCTKKLKAGTKLNIVRSKITTASFTVSFPSSDSTDPLTGAFSIADGKQISFSRGNLYYDGSFKFESKQCDFHGYDSSSNTWGLFGWSTSNTNYGMSTSSNNSDYSGDFVDWGKAIDNNDTWRTLSKDEWVYLFEGRDGAAAKYGYATVYGTYGIIILPDEFTDPMKNGGSGAFVPGPTSGWGSNKYSLGGNWEAMESAGAVFLPAALYRGGKEVMKFSDVGMYWSSSASDTEKAFYMDFMLGGVRPAQCDGRRFGLSVRLVTNLYTVTFDMNGHGTAPESINGIKYGSTITKPSDPTVEYYTFAGWYKDKACTMEWNFESDQVTSNTTLYAKWRINVSGALDGVFSVAEGKRVYFSQGNLVATIDDSGAPTAWKFAANQYDYLGKGGANQTIGTAAGDVDLFGWSTASTYYGISISTEPSEYSGDFVDWGKLIGDGSTWRTLSKDEWVYLFETRTNASSLYKYGVTVCDKTNCVIIAPDNWDTSANPLQTSYDVTTWPAAEAAGLVCLPAAGYRHGSHVNDVGDNGYYWSSTANDEYHAYGVGFLSFSVYPDSNDDRRFGLSVRLITESK